MRDPTGIVQQSASPIVQYAGGKDYASKVNFNCMATSGAAHGPTPQMQNIRSLAIRGGVGLLVCGGCRVCRPQALCITLHPFTSVPWRALQ